MLYQNGDNGLWYYEQTFTNPVNGFVEGCCYENGYNTGSCDSGGGWTGWCVDIFYILNNPTTLPQNGTGWDSYSSTYYIDGNATTLNESGNGYWGITYFFYIGGVQTTLPESGTGWWSNKYYIGGVESPLPESGNGWWNNIYYIGGVETTLPENGTGFWQNPQGSNWPDLYVNGNLFTGWFDNKYYIGGLETNLPQSGTGWWYNWQTWEAWFYINGVQTTLPQNGTGWWNNKYYIEGVESTLPENGNGWWDNKYYINGNETNLSSNGTGWDSLSLIYYIGGNATTLPESGTGWWQDAFYVNGNLFTGWVDNTYYVGGLPTTLPESGTGWWVDNGFYINGVQTTLPESGTGWWNNKYYIEAVQTTLPQNGTGFWQNLCYNSGLLFTGVFQGNRYANGILQNGLIVYRKNTATPWIKQGDRLTKTFASGLCLIQQTYIAPKALATYNAFVEGAAITDSQPCIDGAYIYPAPDYQDTGDGFVRCTVTAYGRWKTEPNVRRQKRKLELSVDGQIQNMPLSGQTNRVTVIFVDKAEVIADDLVLSFVVPPNVDLPLTPPNSLSRLYKINGELFPPLIDVAYLSELFKNGQIPQLQWVCDIGIVTYGYSVITPTEFESVGNLNSFDPKENGISLTLTRCDSVEYGHFSEYTASFEATGTSFTKTPLFFRKK